jgi:hypothetical protein
MSSLKARIPSSYSNSTRLDQLFPAIKHRPDLVSQKDRSRLLLIQIMVETEKAGVGFLEAESVKQNS